MIENIDETGDEVRIYVVHGTKNGLIGTILVTTNLEKAKSLLIDESYTLEVWANDEKLAEFVYEETEGFYRYE